MSNSPSLEVAQYAHSLMTDEPLSFDKFVSDLSRRGFIRKSAAASIGAAGLSAAGTGTVAADDHGSEMKMMTVPEILNYALTLERLEATYYEMAVGEDGAWDEWMVENSEIAKQFNEPSLRYSTYQHLTSVRDHEAYHVTLIEQVLDNLGAEVTAPTEFTFPEGAFEDLDVFIKFAQVVEDLGVSAYAGAAPMLAKAELDLVDGDVSKLEVTPAALGIHSIEARHAGYFRTLNEMQPWKFYGSDIADYAVDDPRTPDEVVSIAGQYIDG